MAGFWPWKKQDDSTASFEKALSSLSAKITATQTQLEKNRSTSRRLRLIWTLYLTFAYLVYSIVLVLVVGWQDMGALEWSGIAAGPVIIYVVRRATSAFFNYRIETLSARLKAQQEERASTIQKLKAATKYDSTLELLEKYGDSENKTKKGKKKDNESEKLPQREPQKGPARMTAPPPATANIPRRDVSGELPRPHQPHGRSVSPMPTDVTAEFAPNAFAPNESAASHYAPIQPTTPPESHWYDRILDTILGEDETAPKNRIVLICGRCRQVNGQAPPGTKSLADVGMWKCMSCGASNGEMDEGKRIVREVLGTQAGDRSEVSGDDADSSDLVEVNREELEEHEADVRTTGTEETSRARQRKSKRKV